MATKKKAATTGKTTKGGFGPVVTRALAEASPRLAFLETTAGGNAPLVRYGVRSSSAPTAVIEVVMFQKGQWGQTNFCVEGYIEAYGPKLGGGLRPTASLVGPTLELRLLKSTSFPLGILELRYAPVGD